MRTEITDEEFWRRLATFGRSAWRFEQQPQYGVSYEDKQFALFLAGQPESPMENKELGEWMRQVARQVSEGKTVGRVRIIDDPITDYQRWMRWMDRWNRKAGETIDYLPRSRAHQAGILPDAGPQDWWLFDDTVLMLMHFDARGVRVKVEIVEDEPEVDKAKDIRKRAIAAARASS